MVRSAAPLAMIVAPPGYGKTSLVAEWQEWDERPFVWLGCAAGPEASDRLPIPAKARRKPVVVVIDKAEQLPPGQLPQLLEGLLAELVPGSTLVLCSRSEPQLPEGRLRAHRLLFELRRPELALSVPQAAELLRMTGCDVERDVAAALVRDTGGWAAAIYLVAAAMHGGGARAGTDLSCNDSPLSQYLHDELLSELTPEDAGWLSRCSVADELTSGLCQALTGEAGSGRRLVRIARQTQLLDRVDGAPARYRWHRLFRELMSGELELAEPERETQLHMRASLFYERHGDATAATEHACLARDPVRAGELMGGTIASHIANGRAQQVLDWLSTFSRDQIATSPALAMSAAHGCLGKGTVVEAAHWAAVARSAIAREAEGVSSADIEIGVMLVEAAAARPGAAGMLDAAERARVLDTEGGQWRPAYLHLLGVSAHLFGNRSEALSLLEQAVDLAWFDAPCTAVLALAQAAMIAIERDDWDLAEELSGRACEAVAANGLERYPPTALCFAASAAARAHQGQLDRAKLDLRRGVELRTFLGDYLPWYGAETSILLAHAALWLADISGARSLLAQASRSARRIPDAVIFERWFTDAWAYMDSLAEANLAGSSSLTIAELRVLRFLPSHRSFREIASQLGVSSNTVKSQAHAVYRKLGASSRSEAVARASDAGLIES
jgi:LuxR family maltose regulon positive regulatory protein